MIVGSLTNVYCNFELQIRHVFSTKHCLACPICHIANHSHLTILNRFVKELKCDFRKYVIHVLFYMQNNSL